MPGARPVCTAAGSSSGRPPRSGSQLPREREINGLTTYGLRDVNGLETREKWCPKLPAFDWEAIEQDQGRLAKKMVINLWFKDEVPGW